MQKDDQGALAFLDIVHADAVDLDKVVGKRQRVVHVPLCQVVGMFQVHRKYSSNCCCGGGLA
ncbi:hypothetical protein D3C84_505360 [compost metagenome]